MSIKCDIKDSLQRQPRNSIAISILQYHKGTKRKNILIKKKEKENRCARE